MDGKDPDSTEEENLCLPAHTDMQTDKKNKKGMGAAVQVQVQYSLLTQKKVHIWWHNIVELHIFNT